MCIKLEGFILSALDLFALLPLGEIDDNRLLVRCAADEFLLLVSHQS